MIQLQESPSGEPSQESEDKPSWRRYDDLLSKAFMRSEKQRWLPISTIAGRNIPNADLEKLVDHFTAFIEEIRARASASGRNYFQWDEHAALERMANDFDWILARDAKDEHGRIIGGELQFFKNYLDATLNDMRGLKERYINIHEKVHVATPDEVVSNLYKRIPELAPQEIQLKKAA